MNESEFSYGLVTYLPRVSVRSQIIYTTVLGVILLTVLALPFIYVDVSVQANGLVRPVAERSEVKATAGAVVEKVMVREWEPVRKGQPLFQLRSDALDTKKQLVDNQIAEKAAFVRDLDQLTTKSWKVVNGLAAPLYRQEYNQFRAIVEESWNLQEKRKRELQTAQLLYSQKAIARLEYEDALYAHKASLARYNTLVEQQRSDWQTDLTQVRRDLANLESDAKQLHEEQELYILKAPTGGTASQLAGRYAGSYVQPGDVLAVVSPDSTLIVEAYVPSKDIGLLKPGQPVRLQVDAFNYNQWGLLTGRVMDIANDFTTTNGEPVFKVRCQLDKPYLSLQNGYQGRLKKGMTVQTRFQVARRSLFQLLYDKADDWLNPAVSNPKTATASSQKEGGSSI
ncbi:HlyD family secretion protein [Spirosoma foliorum]|uniref:HlyD family efflux transporter periplasmic adaptor subunit n=1 Tax=Spirosoma foliorum TaxID=2710596 RepID=A0A7G5GWY6_9BACT|nr:HlyD family efflux transporter periplasmic adaptor subunit [Spirosoma foliorum]QMW03378.1 HlyD family efflux transporter periplasmic adaptor subunit [Spirosoma foliorum]QMW03411.1 HlyD family efflux transporter periplasmic adaptor subunit [Spirosoma foliorum]